MEAALRKQAPGLGDPQQQRRAGSAAGLQEADPVLLAGHLDTVPDRRQCAVLADGDRLFGCGTSDMKSGDGCFPHLAATVTDPAHDVTLVFYDVKRSNRRRTGWDASNANCRTGCVPIWPSWEPTDGQIEQNCQGARNLISTTNRSRTRHDPG